MAVITVDEDLGRGGKGIHGHESRVKLILEAVKAAIEVGGGFNAETLAGAKTIAATDPRFQRLDPGGAGRDVTLPPEVAGDVWLIFNAADAAEDLTVKDDAGGGVCVINQDEAAFLVSDGTDWAHFGFSAVVDMSA